jgi:hypothetical protein
MNIKVGDSVYVNVYNLERILPISKEIQENKFGKVSKVQELSEGVMLYDITLKNGSTINYRSDSSSTKILKIEELFRIINDLDISLEEKSELIDQINRNVF